MKPEDVDEAMLSCAMEAYWEAEGGTSGGVRAAIAAVAQLIAAAEREQCALIADDACDPYGADDGFSARAIADAIRNRSDSTLG